MALLLANGCLSHNIHNLSMEQLALELVATLFLDRFHSLMLPRTADVVASSPRFRRKSSTFVDAIHDLPEKAEMAPAQLYSTESGRLFHSGRIVIITVGLPARGKTFVTLACVAGGSH
jgi:hypothetical protein